MCLRTPPVAALIRYKPAALYVGAASTPPPLRVGDPITGPPRPRCQPGLPVAGFSIRTEPLYVTPPITVVFAATKRCEPSHIAAASHVDGVPALNRHTGPAARLP